VALDDTAGPARLVALGGLLGLMPCMITLWALGLAATTGSPLHGAGVMLTLVAMTTPVLLGVTLLPRLVRRVTGRAGPTWVPRLLPGLSAVWLILVGLAGFGLVPHAHLSLGPWMVMFW
jgi:sulfite exporter TauE/SafE